ncbi:kelch-like protein 40 [Plakobranchus ocellatus]|uniref:Kelch-like protein 40 n=1 Tax=Plakobranchus ocellatus TaxID=259542 RepID=A0AAV4BDS5_9GAST|nr:kelch-like protein 40 [Plakobranchus ocellatus]
MEKLAKEALNRVESSQEIICWSNRKPNLNASVKKLGMLRGFYTVQHILIECPDFEIIRNKYYDVTDMYKLFQETHLYTMDNPPSQSDAKVLKEIFEELKNQRDNEMFHDVVVVAGSSEFNCHRVILSCVSGFFRGLLNSGMKECLDSRVELRSIGGDVFSQILDCIYSGRAILTTKNIFDIWAAADILDINFLLTRCKALFKESLSAKNCIDYCVGTRLLHREFSKVALDLIVKNFERLRYSDRLFKLTFEEMKYIVSSKALVTSCEDDVIETILRWAEFTTTLEVPSDPLPLEDGNSVISLDCSVSCIGTEEEGDEDTKTRSERLADLLECSRYLLTSYSFLVQTLSCHPLMKANTKCKIIVSNISRYLAHADLHQEWCPKEAIHRDGEKLANVFLIHDHNGKASVMYPPHLQCYKMRDASMNLDWPIAAASRIFYQNENLFIFDSANNLKFHTPFTNGWKSISTNRTQNKTVLIGQSLYSFEKNTQDQSTSIYKLNLQDCLKSGSLPCQWQPVCQLSVKGLVLKATTSIGNIIIVFWAGGSSAGFTVECYDLLRRKSTVMKNELGPASDLVTFRRDSEVFALKPNGALWRLNLLSPMGELVCSKVRQLWNGVLTLQGAIQYGGRLFIFGPKQDNIPRSTDSDISYIFDNKRDYVHAVLPRHLL